MLGALAAGAALDPDFLKWEPGARTYFDMGAGRDWTVMTFRRGDIIEPMDYLTDLVLSRVARTIASPSPPFVRSEAEALGVDSRGAAAAPKAVVEEDRHGAL